MGTGEDGSEGVVMRSGQFYSLITVLIAVPIMLFITGTLASVQEMKFSVTEKLVADQLHLVEKSIEKDFKKGVEISFKRALLALTDFVVTNGTYVNESEAALQELLHNGTLFGKIKFLMINNTLNDWKASMLNISTGFDADFNFTSPNHSQSGIELMGTYGLDIVVADRFGISRIEKRDVRKEFSFSIEGFEDPFFPLNSNAFVRRQYKMYPYSLYTKKFKGSIASRNFTGNVTFAGSPDSSKVLVVKDISDHSGWGCVVGDTGTPAQLCYVLGSSEPGGVTEGNGGVGAGGVGDIGDTDFVNDINQTINTLGGYSTVYIDNMTDSVWSLPISIGLEDDLYYLVEGPNVFERIEGTFNSSEPQFMTFVNTQRLQEEGIGIVEGRTRVAWMYFGGFDIDGRRVRGLPDWFRVDDGTASDFSLTQLLQ